jgi:hypothetical protein
MLRYVILWSDNILDLTEKVNKILEGGYANVVGGVTLSQIHNNVKFYQSVVIDEVFNPNTMYSASAIKSPPIDTKDSFEVV